MKYNLEELKNDLIFYSIVAMVSPFRFALWLRNIWMEERNKENERNE